MHSLQINAADTLFFRDGRPFSMGEDTYAQGIFPPPPSVLYGALRTAFIAANLASEKLEKLISQSESLHIHCLFLKASDNKIYAPIPNDLFVPKETDEGIFPSLEDAPTASSLRTPKMLLHSQNEKPDSQTRLISIENLTQYLHYGDTEPNITSVPLKEFIEKETKLGIARNNSTRTSEEGQLYRMEMVRPAKYDGTALSFWIAYSGITPLTETWLRMGGDKKATHLIATGEVERVIDQPVFANDETCFKIYLATPALFENGWYPKIIDNKELTLLAASIGKPLPLGGFDMKERRPKPMLKAVPAGSVYYVKASDPEKMNAWVQNIHGHSISEYYMAQQGFGTAFIGKIKI